VPEPGHDPGDLFCRPKLGKQKIAAAENAVKDRFFHGYFNCYCYLPLYIRRDVQNRNLPNRAVDPRNGRAHDDAAAYRESQLLAPAEEK
jgi:hypothetical protein